MTRAELRTGCANPIDGSTLLLASGLAHDLSNALNGVGLNADLARIMLQRGDTEATSRLIGHVLADFQRSVALLNALRSFASVPNELRIVPVPAAQLLVEARERALQQPWCSDVQIVVAASPGDDRIIACDRESVIHALLQLMRNAAEAGAGTIRLSMLDDGRQVTIAVRDDGPGIAPERLQHLFRMFSSGNRQGGHLGLGLWTVQRICRAQGADVRARNLDPQGAEVGLTFPRSADGG